eukprot:scaffold110255_cov21-Tisochrysis_lutea.AAC.1
MGQVGLDVARTQGQAHVLALRVCERGTRDAAAKLRYTHESALYVQRVESYIPPLRAQCPVQVTLS